MPALSSHAVGWLLMAQEAGGKAPPEGGNGGGGLGDALFGGIPWLPFVLIGVLFYFLLIRPDRRRRADMNKMLDNLKRNDRVVTIGGIIGTVVSVQQDTNDVTIRVDENTNARLRILRSAISRVIHDKDDAGVKKDEF